MAALSQAGLPAAFRRSAAECGVAESDYLLLGSVGILSFEAFALRISSKEDLEEFLRSSICPSAAYQGPDGVLQTFTRAPPEPWASFKMSDDAASLRKLWYLSKEICKAEVGKMAAGDDASRVKVNLGSAVAMEQDAISRGMPPASTDSERPSLHCLTKVARSLLGAGASYEYVPWECFIHLDVEGRLARAGSIPKTQSEVVLTKDAKLSVKDVEKTAPLGEKVSGMEMLRGYLEIRARAHEYLGVARYSTYRRLNEKYLGKLLGVVPEGMRPPTIEEIRRLDRTMHAELFRWLSRSMGTLERGLEHHIRDDSLAVWRLADPVVKGLPDQGVDQSVERGTKRKAPLVADGGPSGENDKAKTESKLKKCLVCGERHAPLCKLPDNFRRDQRAKQKALKREERERREARDGAPAAKPGAKAA